MDLYVLLRIAYVVCIVQIPQAILSLCLVLQFASEEEDNTELNRSVAFLWGRWMMVCGLTLAAVSVPFLPILGQRLALCYEKLAGAIFSY